MKRTFFVLAFLSLISIMNVKGQPTNVDMVDSINASFSCSQNLSLFVRVYGIGSYYNSPDSLEIVFDFGDQTNTNWKIPIDGYNIDTYFMSDRTLTHHYANTGIYDLKVKLIGPDGKSDSSLHPNFFVGTSCDTIKGVLYKDINDNCINNSEPMINSNYHISAKHNGLEVAKTLTNSLSKYYFYLPTGFDYDVSVDDYFDGTICPLTKHITSLPSLHNDFGFFNINMLHTIHLFPLSDSLQYRTKYSCSQNATFDFCMGGNTSGYNYQTDSVTFIFDYGDQSDTVFKRPINSSGWFSGCLTNSHHYNSIGSYNFKLVVKTPDGLSDSTYYNSYLVGSSCDTIKGFLYADANNNCINDGEPTINNYIYLKAFFNNHEIAQAMSSSNNGHGKYFFYLPTGYNYEIIVNNNLNGNFCPTLHTITSLPSINNDFGYSCNNGFDLTGYGFEYGGHFNPGFDAYINVTAYNTGCNIANGKLKLIFDQSKLTPFTSSNIYSITDDTIIWNFTDLDNYLIFQDIFSPSVGFHVDSNAIIGDTVNFTLIEYPLNDSNPANNIQNYSYAICNSWDPNNKQVSPQGKGAEGLIHNNQSMVYTVHFQNTGNSSASRVFIIDTLDENLDISTLTVLQFSHWVTLSREGDGVVKFDFPHINLPDSATSSSESNGYITFSIKQKDNLPDGTEIKNTGYIYFDYNPAVITNTTLNTINSTVSIKEFKESPNEMSVYPNPSTGIIYVAFSKIIKNAKLDVYNITGELVYNKNIYNSSYSLLNLKKFPAGIYLIKVQNGDNIIIKKIAIQ